MGREQGWAPVGIPGCPVAVWRPAGGLRKAGDPAGDRGGGQQQALTGPGCLVSHAPQGGQALLQVCVGVLSTPSRIFWILPLPSSCEDREAWGVDKDPGSPSGSCPLCPGGAVAAPGDKCPRTVAAGDPIWEKGLCRWGEVEGLQLRSKA